MSEHKNNRPVVVMIIVAFIFCFVCVGAITNLMKNNTKINNALRHYQSERGLECVVYRLKSISCDWEEYRKNSRKNEAM